MRTRAMTKPRHDNNIYGDETLSMLSPRTYKYDRVQWYNHIAQNTYHLPSRMNVTMKYRVTNLTDYQNTMVQPSRMNTPMVPFNTKKPSGKHFGFNAKKPFAVESSHTTNSFGTCFDRYYYTQNFHEVHFLQNKDIQEARQTLSNKRRVERIRFKDAPPIGDRNCAEHFVPSAWKYRWGIYLPMPSDFGSDKDECYAELEKMGCRVEYGDRLPKAQYYSKIKCPACGHQLCTIGSFDRTEALSKRHQHNGEFFVWIYSPSGSYVHAFDSTPTSKIYPPSEQYVRTFGSNPTSQSYPPKCEYYKTPQQQLLQQRLIEQYRIIECTPDQWGKAATVGSLYERRFW
jgi:hypothetical protein